MRPLVTLLSVLAVAFVGVIALGRGVTAQDATPTAIEVHPFVGTWELDTDVNDPENLPELAIASADGSWLEVDPEGGTGVGSWESTGASTANLTVWFMDAEEGEFTGTLLVRATVEVAADGMTATATYTSEFLSPDGTGTGQYGPGTAVAARRTADPMGEPLGTLEELFGQFEEASPEASPAP